MTGNEIREKFLQYFERHGHTRVRSSPLLPANDPTLLFANAGMNQFKDTFLGLEKRDYKRATSSQKCLRAGGKHNDLDEVGKTARHHTFFEMLGNFSFGDYFKRDAIQFAWDFLVNELKLDPERLWFTVFGGDDEVPADDEAAQLWVEVGAKPERILRFDRKDNFWQMAETGPCGPNSEINYYLGEHPEDPAFNRADLVNGPGDTTMEIWNLVFMQYNRIEMEPGSYKLEPLPKPSVDTGAGLERLAVVLQGVKSNYDTDLIRDIVEFIARTVDHVYEPHTHEGFAMRVIADHARATAFSIADGILPGNEGRNYVLRKIMRRAIFHGRRAFFWEEPFFYKVTNKVVDLMREAYPELEASRGFIEKMVRMEEQRFGATLIVGLQKLEDAVDQESAISVLLDLKKAARIYDTYGVPRDLIRQALEDDLRRSFGLDGNILPEYVVTGPDGKFLIEEDGFNTFFDSALQELQQTGATEKSDGKTKANPIHANIAGRIAKSQFRGYETTRVDDAKIIALIKDDEVQALSEGDEGEVVLDRTPFYAESGGQVGDVGTLVSTACGSGRVIAPNPNDDTPHPPATAGGTDVSGAAGSVIAHVLDTYSPAQGLIVHKVKVEKGTLKIGDIVTAEVDVAKRDATRRNHTATHLMHAALREVLGTHVKQAGSVVAPSYLRFDFTHYQPLTAAEIEEIENLVNYHILRNTPVETDVMAVEEAMRSGAMALFGEKYGEKVRVLSIKGAEGIFSKELCGGTHVRATGDIGVFKITSDESIASGTRRIRAVTGADALARFQEDERLIDKLAGDLRTTRVELPNLVERLQSELKKARREADELRLKIATGAAGSGSANGAEAREVSGVHVLAREASGLDAAAMRQLSDTLLARLKSGVVVIGRSSDGKASLIVRTSADLLKRVPAGQVIKELAPIIGGRGGGKPDMAEGGGNQPEKLNEALEASYGIVEQLLSRAVSL